MNARIASTPCRNCIYKFSRVRADIDRCFEKPLASTRIGHIASASLDQDLPISCRVLNDLKVSASNYTASENVIERLKYNVRIVPLKIVLQRKYKNAVRWNQW